MNYYFKCWKDRNEKLHDEAFQRKIIIDWHQKQHARYLEGQCPQVRKFAIEKIGHRNVHDIAYQKMDLCSEINQKKSRKA